MKKIFCIKINPYILEDAKNIGFENLSFHVEQWLKNWIEMKKEKIDIKKKIGLI